MTTIELMVPAHTEAMTRFFRGVSGDDRAFFKEDLSEPDLVSRWLTETSTSRFVARDGADVLGYLAVIPGTDRFRHVTELRVVVRGDCRRRGVGTGLARHGVAVAVQEGGASKIFVDVPAPQKDGATMFLNLGFVPEAMLREHVEDQTGARHDLWVFSHFVDDNRDALELMGILEELGGFPG